MDAGIEKKHNLLYLIFLKKLHDYVYIALVH